MPPRRCVKEKCNEGKVLSNIKRQWKADIEAMQEIVGASEVEEMLTPDERRAAAAAPSGLGVSTPVLLAGVAATAAIAVVAANGLAS